MHLLGVFPEGWIYLEGKGEGVPSTFHKSHVQRNGGGGGGSTGWGKGC